MCIKRTLKVKKKKGLLMNIFANLFKRGRYAVCLRFAENVFASRVSLKPNQRIRFVCWPPSSDTIIVTFCLLFIDLTGWCLLAHGGGSRSGHQTPKGESCTCTLGALWFATYCLHVPPRRPTLPRHFGSVAALRVYLFRALMPAARSTELGRLGRQSNQINW